MTVKQLKEILDACNDDAPVIIHTESSNMMLRDHQVYHSYDWAGAHSSVVVIDTDGTYEMEQGKSKQAGDYTKAHDIEPIKLKMLEQKAYTEWLDFCAAWNIKPATKDDK